MKISTTQIFERSIDQMSSQRTKVAEIQAQLAAGKQLVQPSDDAEKTGIIQRLSSAFNRQEVYESTLDSVTSRLEVEESAVMSAENIMQRARELEKAIGQRRLGDVGREAEKRGGGLSPLLLLLPPPSPWRQPWRQPGQPWRP